MLLPSEIDSITNYINQYFVELEDDLVNEIAEGISKFDELNITNLNDYNVLNQMGMLNNKINKQLAKATNKTEQEIKDIVSKSMISSFKRDNIIFSKELSQNKLKISESLKQMLQADINKMNFDLNNLTGTTASTSQTAFYNALNQAHLEVISGASSYTTAIQKAIDKVCINGVDVVYPSGHIDKLEVATRRAIMTSVNQTNGELQLERCKELGWDLVEVSAHIGARPTHSVWQGKVYSLTGRNGYKNFYDETEYGEMLGLCGINCRHTFFPYYKGSERAYTDKMLYDINNAKVTYKGKTISYYEATQYQRYLERNIRQYNRQINGNKTLLTNNQSINAEQVKYSIEQLNLRKQNALNELKEFTDKVGLKQSNRLYGVGSEVKLFKQPNISNTLFTNVKKDSTIGKEVQEIKEVAKLTAEDKKKIEKSLVYGMLESDENYDKLMERTQGYIDALTEEQKRAIGNYSGSWYHEINGLLRGTANYLSEDSKEKTRKQIDEISGALNGKTLGQNAKLFRGVYEFHLDDLSLKADDIEKGEDWLKEQLLGKVYTDKAFQSTSIDPSRAFGGKFRIEYLASEDTNGMFIKDLSMFSNEKEFLLNKNASAVIQDVQVMTNDMGRKYVKLIARLL